jgi:hypothetical protein
VADWPADRAVNRRPTATDWPADRAVSRRLTVTDWLPIVLQTTPDRGGLAG